MRSYGRYWQETFRLPRIPPERIMRETEVIAGEHFDRVLAEGRPVVAALPHSGNWDAGAVWYVDRLGGPFLTVAERLRAGVALRPLPGLPRVARHAGGAADRRAAAQRDGAARVADEGGSVALLCDRDLAGTGIPVTFAGRATTMPGGPALLAAQTGRGAAADGLLLHRARLAAHLDPRGARRAGPAGCATGSHAATQGIADAFAATIARASRGLARARPDLARRAAGPRPGARRTAGTERS